MTAEVIVPDSGAEGVIVAQGGKPGGGSLYAKNGKLKYCYKFYGINIITSRPTGQSPPASTRCAWNVLTAVAALPKVVPWHFSMKGNRCDKVGWT